MNEHSPYVAVDFEGLLSSYKLVDSDDTLMELSLRITVKEEYHGALVALFELCLEQTKRLNTGNRFIISVGEADSL